VKKNHILALSMCLAIVFAIIMLFVLCPRSPFAWAKDQILKITLNGSPSTLKPLESGGQQFVPLSFPLDEGKTTYQVTVDYEKSSGTVKVMKTKAAPKLRGDKTKCPRCGGSGKCQACYPAGSGKNINDGSCSACDGNGKCFYCNGQGEY
jgi:hypothetical protein